MLDLNKFSFNGSNVDFGSLVDANDWYKKRQDAAIQSGGLNNLKLNIPNFSTINKNTGESVIDRFDLNPTTPQLQQSILKLAKESPAAKTKAKVAKGGFMNSKAGLFAGLYGGMIGDAASKISTLVGKRGLDGLYGGITKGMDAAYDTIQKVASNFGPIGNVVSMAMGTGKLLGNAISKIGGGTDGITKTDAILNSAFLNLTPLGLINGFGGKKADTYTRNNELDSQTNGAFQGFLSTQDLTQLGAGKKYGLFSSGARHKLNQLNDFTLNMKRTISGIVDTNTINNLAAQGSTPFIAQQLSIDLSGGIQQMRAARLGMKILRYQNPANPFLSKNNPFKLRKYKGLQGIKNLAPKRFGPEGIMQLYDKDGNPTRGLTREQELGYEPVVGYDGKPRFIGYKSNPALPYMLKSLGNINIDKKGGQFSRRVVSKYLIGNKLKRSIQTIDVVTGKYVELPTDLDKDQIQGRKPIKLANGMVVFMNGDGTVDSDKWETYGKREHLTPKGENGIKIEEFKQGGQMNVIPEGALHARLHHMDNVDPELAKEITNKGIPVITVEKDGEIVQHAEIEHSEIIFTKEVTDKVEELRKQYHQTKDDKYTLKAGKLLTQEILYNTDDRTNLIKSVE